MSDLDNAMDSSSVLALTTRRIGPSLPILIEHPMVPGVARRSRIGPEADMPPALNRLLIFGNSSWRRTKSLLRS
jgi:hypothetical protein